MSLPIYQRVAVTDAGDVIPGAEYTVINENTGVAAPIYSDRTGATLLTAPYFADSAGTIQFFIAQGTTFRVAASGGVGTYTDRYVYGVAEAVLVQDNGDVLVGKTSASVGVKGFAVIAGTDGGYTAATRDGGAPGFFNRLTSDGSVLEIAKGSGVVGSWNSRAGLVSSIILDPRATAGGVGLGATDGNAIVPTDRTGALVNGSKDLGAAASKWKDLYLSGTAYVDGNVGIGGASFLAKLNSNADNQGDSYFSGSTQNTRPLIFSTFATASPSAGHKIDASSSNGVIAFATGSSERMRITSDGKIGIGTASPAQAFSLVSTQNNNSAASILHNGSVSGNQYGLAVSTADDQNDNTRYFFTGIGGVTTRFKVFTNGNVQNSNNSYGALSDQKLKENIEDSVSQWEDLKAVRLRNYSMISDGETSANRLGVIAQELEAAGMGGLVEESDDLDENNESIGTTTKSVKYSILYLKAVGALQEAQTRIESLEERITALEAK